MRIRLLLLIASALLLGGCGGGGKNSSVNSPSSTPISIVSRAQRGLRPAARGCSTAVASSPALTQVQTAWLHTSGPPFGIATTPDGRWAFVDELGDTVAVLSTTGRAPRLVRTIKVLGNAVGNSLTRDGRYLLVADGASGATVISVARAEAGSSDAVLGVLGPPRREPSAGGGAIEVTSSADSDYAFVSLEGSGVVAVYDLRAALAARFHRSSYVGSIPVGNAPVGLAVSPDGRWLYATSELAARRRTNEGTLSTISVAAAERDPARAVVTTVLAHCGPVRVITSSDGRVVWVTARESDQLLAFSAQNLPRDPTHALLAAVRVGEAPVGLALVDGGRYVVVADSNRFDARGEHAALSLVSSPTALAGRPALVGTIRAGSFPREMALEASGRTLLVSNFASDQVEAVSLQGLPAAR